MKQTATPGLMLSSRSLTRSSSISSPAPTLFIISRLTNNRLPPSSNNPKLFPSKFLSSSPPKTSPSAHSHDSQTNPPDSRSAPAHRPPRLPADSNSASNYSSDANCPSPRYSPPSNSPPHCSTGSPTTRRRRTAADPRRSCAPEQGPGSPAAKDRSCAAACSRRGRSRRAD